MNLHWFRNDLRITDNSALAEATKNDSTLCIFILEPHLTQNVSYIRRLNYLFQILQSLKQDLQEHSSDLLILTGPAEKTLFDVCKKFDIQNIYANKDYSPYSIKRDAKIIEQFKDSKTQVHLIKDNVIFEKNDILKKDQTPYKVFTAYKTEWLKKLKDNLNTIEKKDILYANLSKSTKVSSLDINKLISNQPENHNSIFPISSTETTKRWNSFKEDRLGDYKNNRDRLDLTGTSQLSAAYKFGLISIRQIVRDCITNIGNDFDDFKSITKKPQKSGYETYLSEIIWREFYKMILYHFPHTVNHNFQSKFDHIKWENNQEYFDKWCRGETGYPIIDAAMKQLNTIGWMHNRARMIVASFLCKDLHIDWRKGERYFYQQLIDYDISANVGGWQWTAGTGTDAAPYFRIFNPIEQSKRFDPEGIFIKKHLPELQNIPAKYIHAPWELTESELKNYGVELGKDYPLPIVDHATARKKTLEMYSRLVIPD